MLHYKKYLQTLLLINSVAKNYQILHGTRVAAAIVLNNLKKDVALLVSAVVAKKLQTQDGKHGCKREFLSQMERFRIEYGDFVQKLTI